MLTPVGALASLLMAAVGCSRPSRAVNLLAPIARRQPARVHRAPSTCSRPSRAVNLLASIARRQPARVHRAPSTRSRSSRAVNPLALIARRQPARAHRAPSTCSRPSRAVNLLAPIARRQPARVHRAPSTRSRPSRAVNPLALIARRQPARVHRAPSTRSRPSRAVNPHQVPLLYGRGSGRTSALSSKCLRNRNLQVTENIDAIFYPLKRTPLVFASGQGIPRVFSLPHAACELPQLRSRRRRSSLGQRETSTHQGLHAVPGALGSQAELERGGRILSDLLGKGLRCGGIRGPVGSPTSHPGTHLRHWGGRDSIRQGHKYLTLVYQIDDLTRLL